MRFLKGNLSVILFILMEIAIGILLLTDPEGFAAAIVVGFGIALLAIAVVYLVRFFYDKARYGNTNKAALALVVPALIFGCICAFLPRWVLGLFALVAVFCGVMLLLSGVLKAIFFADAKRTDLPISYLVLISAILSAILGIVIIINPFATVKYLWAFVGIALLCEAAVDLTAVCLGARA